MASVEEKLKAFLDLVKDKGVLNALMAGDTTVKEALSASGLDIQVEEVKAKKSAKEEAPVEEEEVEEAPEEEAAEDEEEVEETPEEEEEEEVEAEPVRAAPKKAAVATKAKKAGAAVDQDVNAEKLPGTKGKALPKKQAGAIEEPPEDTDEDQAAPLDEEPDEVTSDQPEKKVAQEASDQEGAITEVIAKPKGKIVKKVQKEADTLGDLTMTQFVGLLQAAMEPLLDSRVGELTESVKELQSQISLKDDEAVELKENVVDLNVKIGELAKSYKSSAQIVKQLQEGINELNGSTPRAVRKMRASQSEETVVKESDPLYKQTPGNDPLNSFVSFMATGEVH